MTYRKDSKLVAKLLHKPIQRVKFGFDFAHIIMDRSDVRDEENFASVLV